MKKPQVTTTAGLAGLTASITNLLNLFGSHSWMEIGTALSKISIADSGLAVLGIVASIYAIRHNEEKNSEPLTIEKS